MEAGNLDIHFSRQWKHEICQKYLKYVFTQGIYLQHRENFEIKECTRVVVGCSYNLLTFEAIFEFGDSTIMEWSYCKRLYCICDCSLELISSSMSLSAAGGRGINGNTHFCSTQCFERWNLTWRPFHKLVHNSPNGCRRWQLCQKPSAYFRNEYHRWYLLRPKNAGKSWEHREHSGNFILIGMWQPCNRIFC